MRMNSRLKKLAVGLLAALALCVAIPLVAVAAGKGVNEIDVSWYVGDEGADEYYVDSAAQLRGLAALVNGTAVDEEGAAIDAVDFKDVTIYQGNDITMSSLLGEVYDFTPIGTAEHPFAGTFDGSNNSITGLYITQTTTTETIENVGLFGYCSADSAIQNVQLSAGKGSVNITSDTGRIRSVGSLVGYTAGTVSGCYSNMTVTVNSTGKTASTVEDQWVVRWIGGTCGYVLGDLTNSGFSGTLDVQVATDAPAADTDSDSLRIGDAIGGLVGRYGDPEIGGHGSITGCYNTGTVYTRTTGSAAEDRFGTTTYARLFFVGGVCGYSNGSIYNCYNGTYNGLTGTTNGTVSTSSIDGADGTALNNRGADETGGICGGLRSTSEVEGRYNDGDADDPMIVYNCNNQGHITGTVACGGIVGEAGVYCTVSCCYNGTMGDTLQTYGKIISTRWNKPISAGILGEGRGSNVSYSANFAEIRNIQTGYYMAGICGALFVSDDHPEVVPELYSCYNTGGIYTINTDKAVEYREAGICGQNEGYCHDSLSQEGCVPYHSDSVMGASDWGVWSNLACWSKDEIESSDCAAYLNREMALSQGWQEDDAVYWFINGSGSPVLNIWANLSDEERTELAWGESGNIAKIECIKDASYTGNEGALPTLQVTLTDGTVLVQNADFYVTAQAGAIEMSEGESYNASITGLGKYRGTVKDCCAYDIGQSSLEDANMVIENMSYNGGKVILPTSLKVLINNSEVSASEYDYVIYSGHVDNTSVQTGATGCTAAYDSLGYISYTKSGEDKVLVSEVGIDAINAETRDFWLWDRNGEMISDSTGAVYYTTTSGGGTAGKVYANDFACTKLRSGTPAGFVVKATAKSTSTKLEGSCIGNYVVSAVNMLKDCTFESVEVGGETWYWNADTQSLYKVDAQGEPLEDIPAATFTGETISPAALITCSLADGTPYTLVEGTDFRVTCGDPDAEETYVNRNVTDYDATPKVRACMTMRPVDTSCFSNYLVAYFAIAPAALESCEVSIEADTWAYTGEEVKPDVTVKLNGVTLIQDVDYTVTYANNTEKGTASYTVTALDNLKGGSQTSVSGTFTITDGKKLTDLTVDDISDQQYNYGYDVHPALTFRDAQQQEVTLTEGTDYTVSYSTTDVTKAEGTNPDGTSIDYQTTQCTATISGIGMYVGTLTKTFDIVPYDAAANTTNQLRATIQTMALANWQNESSVPFNFGLNNPVVNILAYPIVDWAAYEAGDEEAAYGDAIVIGCAKNTDNGMTVNSRPVRYYVYDESKEDGLGALVSCNGETIKNPYESGSGTTLETSVAPANTALTATVAMRVSKTTSEKHNGAVGLLRLGTFEVTAPVEFSFSAGEGAGTPPTLEAAEVGTAVTLPSASELTRAGYEFDGWLCSVDGQVYEAGDSYTVAHVAGPITFTAQWTSSSVPTHKVTFKNGASGVTGTVPTMADQQEGVTFTLPDPTSAPYSLAYEGYTFVGWTIGDAQSAGLQAEDVVEEEDVALQDAQVDAVVAEAIEGTEAVESQASEVAAQTSEDASAKAEAETTAELASDESALTAALAAPETLYYPGEGYTMLTEDVTFTAVWARNATSRTTLEATWVEAVSAQAYTGAPVTPAVVVRNGENILTAGTDYAVAYSNNVNAGTATIRITGLGNYVGAVETTFAISADIYEYTKGDVNDNGKISIVDAQIVLDMANNLWTTVGSLVPFDKLLEQLGNGWNAPTLTAAADANVDGSVTADDARAIQYYWHTGSWLTPAGE